MLGCGNLLSDHLHGRSVGYDRCMVTRTKDNKAQFTLRWLMASMLWLGLVLAICVGYQNARARQREAMKAPHDWPTAQPSRQTLLFPVLAGGEDK
jgi:hypothetical protein